MFKVPDDVNCVPYDTLVERFYSTRPLPLPCLAMSPEAKLPTKENPDDFGWDIYPDHVVTIGRDVAPVHTGLAVAIPPGYGAFIRERSGLARKYGVKLEGVRLLYDVDVWEDVSGGVIDAGYRGPLIGLFSMREGYPERIFSPADKVAQLVILEAPRFTAFWVPELPPSSRGESGFGDSGGVGVPATPEASLGSLGASQSVPEPDPCPFSHEAPLSLLELPREPKGGLKCKCIPPDPRCYQGNFWVRYEGLAEHGPSLMRSAYREWLAAGGPGKVAEGLSEEVKQSIRDAMVEPPIDIQPLIEKYQDDLYRKALENAGRAVVGSVSINGVKLPISEVMYYAGHTHRDGWESARNGAYVDSEADGCETI